MDLKEYRESAREKVRIESLLRLIPEGETVLDIGTRDGYLAQKLTGMYSMVTALDLEEPQITHPKIRPVKGDVTALDFENNAFDTVLCAEVLEHIPPETLQKACAELARVTKHQLIVGVPYKQDIRAGRTTCHTCGVFNPPWGHVNTFDEGKLNELFPDLKIAKVEFVGVNKIATNWLSIRLLDYAGNPFGTYDQEEACAGCGHKLVKPPRRNIRQKLCTRAAHLLNDVQGKWVKARPNWIHVRYEKESCCSGQVISDNKIDGVAAVCRS